MLLRQRETMHEAAEDVLTAAKMRIDACLKSRALTSPLRVTELKRRSVQEKTDLLRRIVSGIVNNAGNAYRFGCTAFVLTEPKRNFTARLCNS